MKNRISIGNKTNFSHPKLIDGSNPANPTLTLKYRLLDSQY